ncbi:hypothetical protein H9P43_001477 [Blastocladiella emersonii ATCC 22665]|nr:hypothetical protein H9P43_001477 [Blastocladiella emersonii ATCC 22665]
MSWQHLYRGISANERMVLESAKVQAAALGPNSHYVDPREEPVEPTFPGTLIGPELLAVITDTAHVHLFVPSLRRYHTMDFPLAISDELNRHVLSASLAGTRSGHILALAAVTRKDDPAARVILTWRMYWDRRTSAWRVQLPTTLNLPAVMAGNPSGPLSVAVLGLNDRTWAVVADPGSPAYLLDLRNEVDPAAATSGTEADATWATLGRLPELAGVVVGLVPSPAHAAFAVTTADGAVGLLKVPQSLRGRNTAETAVPQWFPITAPGGSSSLTARAALSPNGCWIAAASRDPARGGLGHLVLLTVPGTACAFPMSTLAATAASSGGHLPTVRESLAATDLPSPAGDSILASPTDAIDDVYAYHLAVALLESRDVSDLAHHMLTTGPPLHDADHDRAWRCERVFRTVLTWLNVRLKRDDGGGYGLRARIWDRAETLLESPLFARAFHAMVVVARAWELPEMFAGAIAAMHLSVALGVLKKSLAESNAAAMPGSPNGSKPNTPSTDEPRIKRESVIPMLAVMLWVLDWLSRTVRQLGTALQHTTETSGSGDCAPLRNPAALLTHPFVTHIIRTLMAKLVPLQHALSNPADEPMKISLRLLLTRTKLHTEHLARMLQAMEKATAGAAGSEAGDLAADELAVLVGMRIPPAVAATLHPVVASELHNVFRPANAMTNDGRWVALDVPAPPSSPSAWIVRGTLVADRVSGTIDPARAASALAHLRRGIDVVRKVELASCTGPLMQCTTCFGVTMAPAGGSAACPIDFQRLEPPPAVWAPWNDAFALGCLCGGRWWHLAEYEAAAAAVPAWQHRGSATSGLLDEGVGDWDSLLTTGAKFY